MWLKAIYFASLLTAGILMTACGEREPALRTGAAPTCQDPGARWAVERLGERLKRVSLQAPDSVVRRQIREAYAPLVTPDLLETWIASPARVPGRRVSSPWPERIEVRSVAPGGDESCVVEGEVVYVTSVELSQGGAASREPVTLQVVEDGAWRVRAYEPTPPHPTEPNSGSTDKAADVVRRYYAAINARDFRRAYTL